MTANERRAEIMRILKYRQRETMSQLAHEVGVSIRTIRNDVTILTSSYPLDTKRGKGGSVILEEWYQSNKVILTNKQQYVLIKLMEKVDEAEEKKSLIELLSMHGSPSVRKQFTAGRKRSSK